MIKNSYSVVMNTELNPFRNLPKMVSFQFMTTLAFMWSFIFTMWIGSINMFGPSALAHFLILIGVFFTAEIFKSVKNNN